MKNHFQLNESQQKAVHSEEKAILVLAGPGTGKTRTLISRIEYLIKEKKYSPERILAITFTNKAANEVKERLKISLGDISENVFAGTFHGFCLNILRENHNYFNLSRHFNIADAYYQQEIIRNFMQDPGPDANVVKGILRGISNYKIRHIPFRNDYMRDAYEYYKKALLGVNCIDFDDILVMTRSIFTMKTDVLQKWQDGFDAVLVDEFQDTDVIQYEIIRDLAKKTKNIFVVGDDDQSIFSWRGADPGNIEKYIKDFSIAKDQIIVLNENYRTSGNIFSAALKPLMQTTRIYPEKQINVVNGDGEEVSIKSFANRKEEGGFIADKIVKWVSNDQISYADIGVIYPRHVVGSEIEKILLQRHIPARLASGKSMLDHPSVQKILAYLKFVNNPKDSISFRRIVELYFPGPSFKKLEYSAYKQKINFRQAMTRAILSPVFSNLEKLQLKQILGKINNVITRSTESGLFNLIQFILADEDKDGLFRLKGLINEISDPLGELRDNQSAVNQFKSAIEKNSRIVIDSGDDEVDILLKPVLHRLIPNAACLTSGEYIRVSEKNDAGRSIILSNNPEPGGSNRENVKPKERIYLGSEEPGQSIDGSLFISPLNSYSARLFKFLQSTFAGDDEANFSDYIMLDLETTDKDVDTCEIVEIAAIKVVKGKITDRFHQLIKPEKEISPGAQNVHHISMQMLSDAPHLKEIWPDFIRFIGDNLLVAHNGVNFDFQILNRFNKSINHKKLGNVVLDTLPFARQLYPGSGNSIDALIELFNLDGGDRHRAMDDVLVLKSIFEKLTAQYRSQLRKSGLEELLPLISAGIHMENNPQKPEEQIFFQVGYHHLLNRNRDLFNKLAQTIHREGKDIFQEMANRIKNQAPKISGDRMAIDKLHELIYLSKDFEHQYADKKESTSQFIQFLSLYTDAQTLDSKVDAVNLMTLHTCKGLEFDKVVIAGLEDNNLPSYWSYQTEDLDDAPLNKKHEEQRRLFYVGMTRAKSELILTCSKLNERLKKEKPSPFLRELSQ